MRIKSLFTSGKMNKDLDERLVPKGEYRDALNVKVANSTGSNVGSIENALSNAVVSELNFYASPYESNSEANAKCIGAVADDANQKIYWFVASLSGSYICMHDKKFGTSEIILSDEREGTANILNFSYSGHVMSNVIYDNDNEKTYLYFTDGLNSPKKIEVDDAKSLTNSEFLLDDVSVIVKPPISPPSITLKKNKEEKKNNLKERFVQFSYRYKYYDDQYSALSPFSNVAFKPKRFSFDYREFYNECMVNEYDSVDIEYNTGGSKVYEIDIIFKDTSDQTLYLVETINKSEKGYDDNQTQTISFSNNKIYRVLPEKELFRLYDNVPLTAVTQDIVNNRLVYGNYKENYNLTDADQNPVNVDLDLTKQANVIQDLKPAKTIKSNRDYEIGIVYLDAFGRSSTVLSGGANTQYIEPAASVTSNKLFVRVKNKAPLFAKNYRFFVKESATDYDVITSVYFYEDNDEEVFYVKIDKSDINKVKEGDYLVLKSDTGGPRTILRKVKVLAIEKKERNFLDTTDSSNTLQVPGMYMKVSSDNTLDLESDDIENIFQSAKCYACNDQQTNNATSQLVEGPFFYGDDAAALDDLTYVSAAFDVADYDFTARVEVKIIDPENGVDRYKTRIMTVGYHTSSGYWSNWSDPVDITGANQTIAVGTQNIVVRFGATTGHEVGSKWTFNYKTGMYLVGTSEKRGKLKIPTDKIGTDPIGPGSDMNIIIEHTRTASFRPGVYYDSGTVIASREYANIEEFYFEEKVYEILDEQGDQQGSAEPVSRTIHFRRGTYADDGDKKYSRATYTTNTSDTLILESISPYGAGCGKFLGGDRYSKGSISLRKRETAANNVIFETEPKVENSDVYYEVGKTYQITEDGYHLGDSYIGDTDQTHNKDAVIEVDYFNAFSWGNGFESIKIKDAFNAPTYLTKTRPLSSIERYMQNTRINSLTYSNVFDQTTRYNGLNEFNLSTANYKDLDDADGSIQKIMERKGDLIVFQENKVSNLLMNKNVLFTADGQGQVSQSSNVIGQQIPYLGEYGISTNPQSVIQWGGRIYFADARRGAIMRLSQDGLTEISMQGMRDWFKDNIQPRLNRNIIGGYDPFNGQYVVSIQDALEEWREDAYECEGVAWIPDTFECEQETTTTTVNVTTSTSTTSTTLPTFNCTTASFSLANGAYGASTSGQGTVSAGTIQSISPSTYVSGSGSYTATILVPSGYSNSGTTITCIATATGTTTTPAPNNPCVLGSSNVTISNVSWNSNGTITGTASYTASSPTANQGSPYPQVTMSASASGGSFFATDSNFYSDSDPFTGGSASGSANFSLYDSTWTANGTTTVTVTLYLCGDSQTSATSNVSLTTTTPPVQTTAAVLRTATLHLTKNITGSQYTETSILTATGYSGDSYSLSWSAQPNNCYAWGTDPGSINISGTFSNADVNVYRTVNGSVVDETYTATYSVTNSITGPAAGYTLGGTTSATGTNGTSYSLSRSATLNTGYRWVTQPTTVTATGTFACANVTETATLTGEVELIPTTTSVCSTKTSTMYLSAGRGSLSDFCCGNAFSVTSELETGSESYSQLNQTVCQNGSTFSGGNNYYIVSDVEYSYQGTSSFNYWRINSSGTITSTGTYTSCNCGGGSGGDEGGGGNEY